MQTKVCGISFICHIVRSVHVDETPEGEDFTKDRGHDCNAPAGNSPLLCGGHSSKTDKTCGM